MPLGVSIEHTLLARQAHQREEDAASGAASHRTMTSQNRRASEKRPKMLRTEQEVRSSHCPATSFRHFMAVIGREMTKSTHGLLA